MSHRFSFSGCGFLGIYHLGVSACLKQHVPNLLEDCKIAGASAGSFVACCLITGCSIDECTRYVLDLVDQAESQPILGPLHPRFQLTSGLRESMYRVLPPDAYKIATGRLFISLTRCKDLKNIIVSEYESNTELIDAMLCSGFVPLYSGIIPPKYKDDYYFDGGISDNQPVFDEPTITVSPFSGETDICPLDNSSNFVHVNICNSSVQFTQENLHRLSIALFPPKSLTMSEICEQGYSDTLRYLQKNGMINCVDHLNVPAMPSFQKKDIQREDEDGKEKAEKKPEDDIDCRECKQKFRKTLFSSLPPHILKVFHSTMTSNKQNLLNYVSQGKLFQAVSMIITPFIAPADILWASFTSLINKIPNNQQKLKEFHFLFLYFMHNFLDKLCKRNKEEIKIDECMDTAYSYFYDMEKLFQEQVSQNMDDFPKDNNESSQNPNPIGSNAEVEVENLEKNQESPNQTDSKEFPLTSSCSIGTEIGPTKNTADQPHLEILTDPVICSDKEQSKNNVQNNKSVNMEANNEQNHQMNLSDLKQDKSHLEILTDPVICSDKEQSKNNVQKNKSVTMEANNEQNHQMNISDLKQDKSHLEILTDPVICSDKEQSKNNVQKNKSVTMEANNEQNHQMNISDLKQDKSHLEILYDPVKNSLDKEQSTNDIQINESESMEANKKQSKQLNLSEFEQDITVTDKPQLDRSQRVPLHESVHDKESRSPPNRETQNKGENMEAHKNQYLLRYKECNTSTDQFPPEKLPSGPLLCSQSNMEYNEENKIKNQMKIMEVHKEEKICEECDFAIEESPTETSVDEHLVDEHLVDKHLVDEHLVDKHLVDEHLVDEHLVDEHLVDEHLVDEHLVDKHQVDEHLVDEHLVDEHLVDKHLVDEHLVDKHQVDEHLVDEHLVDEHLVDKHQVDEHLVDEHLVDEHLVDKHLVDEHLVDKHLVDEHLVDKHLVDEHLVDKYLVDEHLVDEHLVDKHLVDEHLVDEHLVDEHLVDKHLVDCEIDSEHLDGLKNETISFKCEDSLITVDQRFLTDQLESSEDVKVISHSENNIIQSNEENSQAELSKCDENNEKSSNSDISLNYRYVRTLSIQNYAEDTEEIQNGSNNFETGHILSPITDSISSYSSHLIQRVSIAQVWSRNVIKKLTSPVPSSQK